MHFWTMAALTLSFIDSQLATHLSLKGTKTLLEIKTVRNNEESVESQLVSFSVSPMGELGNRKT